MPLNKRALGPVVDRLREDAATFCASCSAPAFECIHRDATSVACVNQRCEVKADALD